MNAPTNYKDAIFAVLNPELEKLCKNSSRFGALALRAEIHNGVVSRVSLVIETSKKIKALENRAGGQNVDL